MLHNKMLMTGVQLTYAGRELSCTLSYVPPYSGRIITTTDCEFTLEKVELICHINNPVYKIEHIEDITDLLSDLYTAGSADDSVLVDIEELCTAAIHERGYI